jgi:hypothetical protein
MAVWATATRLWTKKWTTSTPIRYKILFPRMGDYSQGRPQLYRRWIEKTDRRIRHFETILNFLLSYQLGWMYWRYFMWNFAGRQNGEQGLYSWDPSAGNWISGIEALTAAVLAAPKEMPDFMKNNQARNKYYMIPFLLGLLGLFFHYQRRPRDFAAL